MRTGLSSPIPESLLAAVVSIALFIRAPLVDRRIEIPHHPCAKRPVLGVERLDQSVDAGTIDFACKRAAVISSPDSGFSTLTSYTFHAPEVLASR
jgi:hypothetical protein